VREKAKGRPPSENSGKVLPCGDLGKISLQGERVAAGRRASGSVGGRAASPENYAIP